MWERSFVAVSMLVSTSTGDRGDSLDDALGALPEGSEARLGDFAMRLRDARRPVRAQALAVVAQEVTMAVNEVTLR